MTAARPDIPAIVDAGPAWDVVPITPSDTVDLAAPIRSIRATGAGNVVVVTASGAVRTCAFAAGETRQIRATRINSTSTTATGLEGHV